MVYDGIANVYIVYHHIPWYCTMIYNDKTTVYYGAVIVHNLL